MGGGPEIAFRSMRLLLESRSLQPELTSVRDPLKVSQGAGCCGSIAFWCHSTISTYSVSRMVLRFVKPNYEGPRASLLTELTASPGELSS